MFRMMVGMVVSISAHLSLFNSKKVNKIVVNNDGRNSAHFAGRERKKSGTEHNLSKYLSEIFYGRRMDDLAFSPPNLFKLTNLDIIDEFKLLRTR